MHKKSVLFIVNGLGLGNSTRCAAIIHELFKLGYHIDVLTSANGLNYFEKPTEVSQLFSFQALLYGKTNGKLSILKTILAIPKLFIIFVKNCWQLKSILKKNPYDAIVFDSDYTVASLLLRWQRPRPLLIAVNNAQVIVNECKKLTQWPKNILLQYWIEKLDCWFHYIVPDLIICPTFGYNPNFNKNTQFRSDKTKVIPPIVRSGLISRPKSQTPTNILVMLSGSQFGSKLDFLNRLNINTLKISVIGKDGESNEQLRFYGKFYNNQDLINTADILVINAGFSAVSEAIALRIPAVVIPIEYHAEQYINSFLFEKSGLGLIATEENAHEKIIEILYNFKKYKKIHEDLNAPTNGAQMASSLIEDRIRSQRSHL